MRSPLDATHVATYDYEYIVDPAGSAFKSNAQNTYEGAGFSGALYKLLGITKKAHTQTLEPYHALLNPTTYSVGKKNIKVIHVIGPNNGDNSMNEKDFFSNLKQTFEALQRELRDKHVDSNKGILLPFISGGQFRGDISLSTYMKQYVELIHTYLHEYKLVLNIFTEDEHNNYMAEKKSAPLK